MGILEIEDASGKIEVVCFPKIWSGITPPEKGKPLIVRGVPRARDDLSLIAQKVMTLEDLDGGARRWLRLRVIDDGLSLNGRLRDVYRELKGHVGDAGVLLEVPLEGMKALLKVRDLFVEPSAELSARIIELSGGGIEVV
jgi:DNA polymerase III alpha subunit